MDNSDHNLYLCFTTDHDLAEAIKRFTAKFGTPPKKHFEYNRMLWVGPAPEEYNHAAANGH